MPKLTGVPMSIKCCTHMEKVLGSKADLKASKAGGLVRVWPLHFQQFCRFRTCMFDAELRAVWGKDEKQVKKLIDKNTKRKAAMVTGGVGHASSSGRGGHQKWHSG